jgi:hypothetical protein
MASRIILYVLGFFIFSFLLTQFSILTLCPIQYTPFVELGGQLCINTEGAKESMAQGWRVNGTGVAGQWHESAIV